MRFSQLISLPSLVLVSILSLAVLFCLNHSIPYPERDAQYFVRVVSIERSVYGPVYQLESNKWKAITYKNLHLSLGHEYLIQVNKVENYTRTVGWQQNSIGKRITAEIDSLSIIKTFACDFVCKSIQLKSRVSRSLENSLLRSFCNATSLEYFTTKQCSESAYFATGLLVGTSSIQLDKQLKNTLNTLNISHLVAVSGFQIVLISSFLESIMQKIRARPKLRLTCSIALLILYGFFVGFQPPVVRSLISLIIAHSILIFVGRKITTVHSLVYSSCIMMLFSPLILYSVSFQLSCFATLGLICAHSISSRYSLTSSFWKSIRALLLETVFAWLFVLPILTQFASSWSVFGLLANLLIVPAVGMLTIFGASALLPFFGEFFGFIFTVIWSLFIEIFNFLTRQSYLPNIFSIDTFSMLESIVFWCVLIVFTLALVLVPKNTLTRLVLKKRICEGSPRW